MNSILKNIFLALVSKKKVIGWGAVVIFTALGIALSMPANEVKDAFCGAKVEDQKTIETQPKIDETK